MNKLILLTSVAMINIAITSESWAVTCTWEDGEHTKLTITGSDDETFYDCPNDIHKSATKVTFKGGITSIGYNAFSEASSLQSVDMPNVTSIGSGAFSYATSLQSVSMPNVTSIGKSAFTYTSLQSVDMPNVTSIGDTAFKKATSLSYAGLNPSISIDDIGSDVFSGTNIPSCNGEEDYCGSCPTGQSVMPGRGCVTDCGTGYIVDNLTNRCVANTQTEQQGQGDSQESEQQGDQGSGQATSAADCAASGKYWQEGKCVSSCGPSFKLNDGWCDRQRYTPAEAAAILNDDDNTITITFKK